MTNWELEQVRTIIREELERHRAMVEEGLKGAFERDRRSRSEAEIERRRSVLPLEEREKECDAAAEEWR